MNLCPKIPAFFKKMSFFLPLLFPFLSFLTAFLLFYSMKLWYEVFLIFSKLKNTKNENEKDKDGNDYEPEQKTASKQRKAMKTQIKKMTAFEAVPVHKIVDSPIPSLSIQKVIPQ